MSIELINYQENGNSGSSGKMTQIQPILPDNVVIDEPNSEPADLSHISLHQVKNTQFTLRSEFKMASLR